MSNKKELASWTRTVLYLDYISLPDDMQTVVNKWLGFGNDRQLPFSDRSEFEPKSLSMKEIATYHKEQSANNNFKGTLDEFIAEYGLQFEKFLIEQNFNLKGVDEIVVNVQW
jgi:hypothetical protein